jgi:centromeric protein E
LNAREDAESVAWASDSTSISQISAETNRPNGVTYTFDRVYDPYIGTEEVYNNTASDIIKSVLEGVNGTIFAYGQTSSGKTFTMRGNSASPGIISLAIDDIFKFIQQSPNTDFLLRVSYMEIYNEVITDLLNPSNTNLKIHEDIERGVYVGGATEEIVTSQFQMLGILARGDANRKVGQTMMNTSSSRSHSIFRMVIESSEKDAENGVKSSSQGRLSVQLPGGRASKSAAPSLLGRSAVKVSLLNLVDLAGSERARQTGAAGIRLKEGSHINKSLLTLERVISKLSDGKKESAAAHIPYRDSKLTRILQPALGGNSRTAIICNVTPAWIHQEESHSTLKFASAAKKISNKPQVNEVVTDQALLQRYRTQISSLEEQIEAMKRQQEDSASMIASSSLASSLTHSTQTSPSRLSVGSMGSAAEASLSPIEAPLSAEEVYRRKEQLLQLTDGIVSAKKLKKMAKNRRQTWCPGPSMSTAEAERILASVQTPSRENGPPSTFRDASPSLLSFSGAASPSASNLINFGVYTRWWEIYHTGNNTNKSSNNICFIVRKRKRKKKKKNKENVVGRNCVYSCYENAIDGFWY